MATAAPASGTAASGPACRCHTFGHPVELDALIAVCERWHLVLVEDAAESLGSYYKGHHTGNFGRIGVLSFNGNKIMTTGGGGMLLTDEVIGKRAKHLTTTAKIQHPYEFVHDEVGYNYRPAQPKTRHSAARSWSNCLPLSSLSASWPSATSSSSRTATSGLSSSPMTAAPTTG